MASKLNAAWLETNVMPKECVAGPTNRMASRTRRGVCLPRIAHQRSEGAAPTRQEGAAESHRARSG